MEMVFTWFVGVLWDATGGRVVDRRRRAAFRRGETVIIPGFAASPRVQTRRDNSFLALNVSGSIALVVSRRGEAPVEILLEGATAIAPNRSPEGPLSFLGRGWEKYVVTLDGAGPVELACRRHHGDLLRDSIAQGVAV